MHVVDINHVINLLPELEILGVDHLVKMIWPFAAMVPGVLLGLLSNYMFSDRWVFRSAVA